MSSQYHSHTTFSANTWSDSAAFLSVPNVSSSSSSRSSTSSWSHSSCPSLTTTSLTLLSESSPSPFSSETWITESSKGWSSLRRQRVNGIQTGGSPSVDTRVQPEGSTNFQTAVSEFSVTRMLMRTVPQIYGSLVRTFPSTERIRDRDRATSKCRTMEYAQPETVALQKVIPGY